MSSSKTTWDNEICFPGLKTWLIQSFAKCFTITFSTSCAANIKEPTWSNKHLFWLFKQLALQIRSSASRLGLERISTFWDIIFGNFLLSFFIGIFLIIWKIYSLTFFATLFCHTSISNSPLTLKQYHGKVPVPVFHNRLISELWFKFLSFVSLTRKIFFHERKT